MLPSSWESGAVLCGDTARGEPGSVLTPVSFLAAAGMWKDTFMNVGEGRKGQQGCKGPGLGVLGAVDAAGGCWMGGWVLCGSLSFQLFGVEPRVGEPSIGQGQGHPVRDSTKCWGACGSLTRITNEGSEQLGGWVGVGFFPTHGPSCAV